MKKLLIALLIIGCAKENNGGNNSYIFNYNPDYNDPIGTEYAGRYYPMGENFTWNYNGMVDMTQNMVTKIDGVIQESDADTSSMNVILSINILDTLEMNLSGIDYLLHPIQSTDSDIRYFHDTDSMIYYMADNNNSEVIEKEYPNYLIKPLVVGEFWETSGQLEYQSIQEQLNNLAGIDNALIDGTSATYIVGKESIILDGESQDAIRVDHIGEFIISFVQEIQGVPINYVINMELIDREYLIENIGLVKSSLDLIMALTASGVVEGQSLDIAMTINQEMNLTLDSYSLADPAISRYDDSNPHQNFEVDFIKNIYSDKIDLKSLFKIVRGIIF